MYFLPCSADYILRMSLCLSWHNDNLIWHYSLNVMFVVKSYYYLVLDNMSKYQ